MAALKRPLSSERCKTEHYPSTWSTFFFLEKTCVHLGLSKCTCMVFPFEEDLCAAFLHGWCSLLGRKEAKK